MDPPRPKDGFDVYFRRRHSCELEYASFQHGDMDLFVEYYKTDAPKGCPYAFEHEAYGLINKCRDVNYGISRHFSRTRVCQHCGEVIANKKSCPNCGYERFATYRPYDEKALLISTIIKVMLYILMMVVMICSKCRS